MKLTLIKVMTLMALGSMMPLQADERTSPSEQINSYSPHTNQTDGIATETDPDTGNDTMNVEPITAEEFVDTASAKGVAEIEMARMALKDGTPHVHDFANRVIKDHTQANEKLKQIAREANLKVSDDPTLLDRAKGMILKVRDGESFDQAYIKNQISAHEEAIELFNRGTHAKNPQIQAFAQETLPTLREHLEIAKNLKAQQDSR